MHLKHYHKLLKAFEVTSSTGLYNPLGSQIFIKSSKLPGKKYPKIRARGIGKSEEKGERTQLTGQEWQRTPGSRHLKRSPGGCSRGRPFP